MKPIHVVVLWPLPPAAPWPWLQAASTPMTTRLPPSRGTEKWAAPTLGRTIPCAKGKIRISLTPRDR